MVPNITLDDWSSVPAFSSLQWLPCFKNYTCARLEVPLDYDNRSLGTTAIAFIKLSATNVTADTRSLLVNPGGPGGSGIEAVLSQGADLTQIVQGQHNVVGFDPRGVGRSGPVVDCWPNYPEGRAQFEQMYYPDISNASSTSTGTQFAAAEIFGKACTPTVGGSNGTTAYVSTPAVARDMLSYLQAEQAATGRDDTKLWYYGLSYGTVLGATFAHLFPDRVGRMILDGVVDAEDYYNLGWKSNLYDADQAIFSFIQSCFDAGHANCSFWGPSVEDISTRLDELLHDLKYQPIPIAPSDLCPLPMLATYSDLKQVILQATYSPLVGFPNLAAILSELEQGNATTYSAAVTSGATPANPCNYAINGATSTQDIATLIKCVDGAGGSKFSDLSEFKDYISTLNEQSTFFGDVWPNNANGVACRAFNVSRPKSGILSRSILATRHTANPILFVTTEVDPVAPKRGAHKMSLVFPGSVVLTQNSVGHTAFASASTCLAQRIQAYLLHGALPPANTTCQPDVQPFQAASDVSF
ncbi:TAP-like protein-domain-containing protein [Aspergillus carlsbadensis]|nr:TAP-like protein-domain-containing protein [Aspergillus carlsbadensis]